MDNQCPSAFGFDTNDRTLFGVLGLYCTKTSPNSPTSSPTSSPTIEPTIEPTVSGGPPPGASMFFVYTTMYWKILYDRINNDMFNMIYSMLWNKWKYSWIFPTWCT